MNTTRKPRVSMKLPGLAGLAFRTSIGSRHRSVSPIRTPGQAASTFRRSLSRPRSASPVRAQWQPVSANRRLRGLIKRRTPPKTIPGQAASALRHKLNLSIGGKKRKKSKKSKKPRKSPYFF